MYLWSWKQENAMDQANFVNMFKTNHRIIFNLKENQELNRQPRYHPIEMLLQPVQRF